MIAEKEMTAPIPSVAAEAGQSSEMNYAASITQTPPAGKENLQELTKQLRAMQRKSDPDRLQTFTMEDLYETVYPPRPPIIDGLLYPGTYIFAGAPKVGKSFLMEQLAYHVSTGLPLWEFPVRQGTVLYLALEDPWTRLQKRVLSTKGTASNFLQLSIDSETINKGLIEQIDDFLRQYPDIVLVAVDTFQHIRDTL